MALISCNAFLSSRTDIDAIAGRIVLRFGFPADTGLVFSNATAVALAGKSKGARLLRFELREHSATGAANGSARFTVSSTDMHCNDYHKLYI
jgi:hypothetical protein